MMWCVDDRRDCWRAWSKPADDGLVHVVYSLEEWYAIDPDAAMAYHPPLRAQHEFIRACGLHARESVNASIVDALT